MRFNTVSLAQLYLKNIEDYDVVNQVYSQYFGTHRPARSVIVAGNIPAGAMVEMDAIVRCVNGDEYFRPNLPTKITPQIVKHVLNFESGQKHCIFYVCNLGFR